VPKKKGTLSRAATLAHEINAALGTSVRLGNDPSFEIVRIPTGSLTMDRITGGGFPLGRHVELYGDESACKSYITYRCMAEAQRRGKICALVDPEKSFDRDWFKHLGGRPNELLTFRPETADEGIAAMMMLAKHAEEKDVEVITIDSVSSFVPREDMERDPRDEDRIGSQARMMSRALRKITTVNRQTLFLWINQERTNIGIRFGNPKTTSGGKALRYYATTRIEMRKGGKVLDDRPAVRKSKLVKSKASVGRWIQVRVEKDKSNRPYREGSFIFDAERAEISRASEIIELGLLDGIIVRSGNSFIYTDLDDKIWRGTYRSFGKWLRENETLASEIAVEIADNTIRQASYGGEDENGSN
jgi:recombination protein RecA